MKRIVTYSVICQLVLVSAILAGDSQSGTRPDVGILDHRNEVFALTGGTIVTRAGRTIEKGTILVQDGKVLQVGTNIVVPPNARVIDLKDKMVYPGFVDVGVEVDVPNAEAQRGAPHWSGDITPEKSVAKSLPADGESTSAKLRKAGITAALLAPRDGIIKGTSAVVLTSSDPVRDTLIKSDVAMHVRLTVTRGRGREGYPGSPMGAVALARQTFLDAQWYSQAWQAYRAQPGIEKPELNDALSTIHEHVVAGKPVFFDALNEQYALRAASFGREFGLNVVLKGSGQEYQLLDPIAKLQRPIIVPLNFPKPPTVNTVEAALDAELEELTHWELAPENPGRLANAGVTIALTTYGLSDPNEWLGQIRKAIKRGLDKDIALDAITATPARLLGVENQIGSIAAGTWANFVITNGDLWDDKTKIEEVWVRGERPNSAYAIETSIDGKWEVTTLPPGTETRPQQLILTISDSTKKIQASIELPKAKEVPTPESNSNEPKSVEPKPTNNPAETPAETPSDKPAANAPPKSEPTPESTVTAIAVLSPPSVENPTGEDPKPDDQEKSAKPEKSSDKPAKKLADKGKAKIKNPKWEDLTLSGTFPVDALVEGQSGVATVSIALLEKGPDDASLIGTIQWPDGSSQSIKGTRKPKEEKGKADKPSDGDAKPVDASDKAKGDGPADADTKKGEAKKEDSKKEPKKEKPILSTIHYPPGIQGRDGVPEQPEYVVFQNGTIWTSGPQGTLADADLLIHHGLVEAVGVDLAVPAGALIIDAAGMQITPGLIDCHSHMATDGGINEAGQAVTAEVRIGDFVDAGDITVYRQLAGGLTSANVLHGSANPIGGQNQVIKLRWGGTYDDFKFAEAPSGIKFALGENVKQSNGDVVRTRYPTSRMGVEQIYRDRLNAAVEYDAAWRRWNKDPRGLPPRRDLELEALAEVIRGERWIHCHSYRQDEILGFLRVMEDYKVRVGSLQHILEGYKVAEAIAKHGATASSFSDWWAYKFEVWDAIPYNGAIMHNHGIVVSFNSDDAELGRHMNHEAAKAVKYGGVEPAEALKFVTLNPAKQLRIDAYVGSLEPGKHADVALWNGSPLSPRSRCEQTWIDGRKYFDRSIDAAIQKRDFDLKQALIQKILDSGESTSERSSLADDPSRLWPHHDEYCHHHHDDDDDQHAEHDHQEE